MFSEHNGIKLEIKWKKWETHKYNTFLNKQRGKQNKIRKYSEMRENEDTKY